MTTKKQKANKMLTPNEIVRHVTPFMSRGWRAHRKAVLAREASRMKVNK